MASLHFIPVSSFLLLLCSSLLGSDPWRPSPGAAESGMGYVCVMKNSFWSSFHNQAVLPHNSSLSAGFNYENRYGLKELGTRSAGVIVPAGKASFGAIYSYFGFAEFRRESAGLAYGMNLSEKISAGVQLDYFSEKSSGEYSNSQYLSCEAGLLLSPAEDIRIGIHIFNPLPQSLNRIEIPSRLRIGAGINLSPGLFAGVETEMNAGKPLIVKTGLEYETMKRFWLRGGYSTDNNSFSFGLGFFFKFVKVDLGFLTHEKLGITSSASLIFNFGKEIKKFRVP